MKKRTDRSENLENRLHYYIIRDDEDMQISDFPYPDSVKVLHLKNDADDKEKGAHINNASGTHIDDISHYGKAAGLYYIWKNDLADYVGFSLIDKHIYISSDDLKGLLESNIGAILLKPIGMDYDIRTSYRNDYYDHDLCVVREILKRDHPDISEFYEKKLQDRMEFLLPCSIMRKDIFRKFCMWLFPILEETLLYCGEKTSLYQNRFLEHLTYYLLYIYTEYYKEKIRINYSDDVLDYNGRFAPAFDIPQEGTLLDKAQELINSGHVETLAELINTADENDQDYADLKMLYEDYKRERRFFKQTFIDKNKSIKTYLAAKSEKKQTVPGHKLRVLVLRWNSINNNDFIDALEKLDLEVDYIKAADMEVMRKEDRSELFNHYIDEHPCDVVCSSNYFGAMAEACYSHGVPYIAWCYDSPTHLAPRYTLKYDTSNVFLFDTEEVYIEQQEEWGANIHYMPLAANCDRYDKFVLSDEDLTRYTADISFVGQLYENKLNEYLFYFDDYKKAFINGVIDYNVGRYDIHILSHILNLGMRRWMDDKAIRNAIYKGESKLNSNTLYSDDPEVVFGRLGMRINTTIANRERLLILSMLSKHFNVNLYSTSSHEVLSNVNNCGIVDYNSEMPKVFKASKINLNITLKSIRNGIPLRCMDVMGCHAFLLSNYQRDFEEHFTDGENIALYSSVEEAYEKSKFYLEHEDLRQKIADRGYETVRKYYSYRKAFIDMFKIAGVNYIES